MTEGKKPSARKPGAELRAMLAVVANAEFFPKVRGEIHADDLEDPAAKEIFILLEECFRSDALSFDAVLEHCKDEELRSVMTDAYTSGEFSTRAEEIVDDSIRRIQRNVLEKQKAGLIAKIKLAPVSGNSRGETDVDEMIARIREIDGKLKDLKEA